LTELRLTLLWLYSYTCSCSM